MGWGSTWNWSSCPSQGPWTTYFFLSGMLSSTRVLMSYHRTLCDFRSKLHLSGTFHLVLMKTIWRNYLSLSERLVNCNLNLKFWWFNWWLMLKSSCFQIEKVVLWRKGSSPVGFVHFTKRAVSWPFITLHISGIHQFSVVTYFLSMSKIAMTCMVISFARGN